MAVQALQEKIRTSQDEDERRLLAVKIYGELMASMEDLGALCIAVRHRLDGVGLVHAYLTYETRRPSAPVTTLKDIYRRAAKGNALVSSLRLPPLDDILQKIPDLSGTILPELYREANHLLAAVARAYLYDQSAFVRGYNKTKHGFPVVKDKHLFQPDPPLIVPETAWIVSENPSYHPDKRLESPVVELYEVELGHVDGMVELIATIRGAVAVICRLTENLLERSLISTADDKA